MVAGEISKRTNNSQEEDHVDPESPDRIYPSEMVTSKRVRNHINTSRSIKVETRPGGPPRVTRSRSEKINDNSQVEGGNGNEVEQPITQEDLKKGR